MRRRRRVPGVWAAGWAALSAVVLLATLALALALVGWP